MWATVQLREQIFTSWRLSLRQQEQLVWQRLAWLLLSWQELFELLQKARTKMLRLLILISCCFLSKV